MNNARRHLVTLAIVIAAAGVAWWSSYTRSSVMNHVQQEVEKLIPLYQTDPKTIHTLVVDPILEPILASSLQFVYAKSVEQHQDIVVVVRRGDDDIYGDGTATHVATIRLNKKPVAGLRIICASNTDPLRIAGVWTP